jgi:signal transduction histidine kinase
MDDNSLIIHTVAMDVVPISEMVTDIFRDRAEAKNITLHFESAEREMTALADEQMYNQIIENILSNAIKYSPLGKNIFVRIALRDTVVRVEVQDEGPGISSEDMQKLFGKFARLSARPTGGEHSTGLGLNIVKKMVAAMHGKVWCESELGKGATFIVELPHDGK